MFMKSKKREAIRRAKSTYLRKHRAKKVKNTSVVGNIDNDRIRIKNITTSLTTLFARIAKYTASYYNKERAEARAWEVLRRLLCEEPLPADDPDAGTFRMYFDTPLRLFLVSGASLAEIKSAVRAVPNCPFSKWKRHVRRMGI